MTTTWWRGGRRRRRGSGMIPAPIPSRWRARHSSWVRRRTRRRTCGCRWTSCCRPMRRATGCIASASRRWMVRRGQPLDFGNFDVGGKSYLRTAYEAFLYTERGGYRPGETLHLRAIVRGGDGSAPVPFPVRWQLRRPDQRDWKSEVVTLDGDGA